MRRTVSAAALALSASVALAGCGSDDAATSGSGTGGTGGELRSITVATAPIADYAPLYVGVEQGFFEDHGLSVEFASGRVGTETITSVLSGTNEFAGVAVPPLLVAQSRGLAVSLLTPAGVAPGPDDASGARLLATAASGIDSVDDLAGKTIAVNALQAQAELQARLAIESGGGDPESVQFVEVPFPEMPSALERGDVDAITAVEPFLSTALGAGAVPVADLDRAVPPGTPSTAFFTSAQLAQSDPELVEQFKAAMIESLEFAAANPDAVRAIVPEYSEVTPEIAAQMALPVYGSTVDRSGVESVVEAMQKFGFLDAEPDIDAMLQNAA